MSLAEAAMPDRRPSPGLTLNLSSNNPFRNRAVSPAIPSPAPSSAHSAPTQRPVSRNPFLNPFEDSAFANPFEADAERSKSPWAADMATGGRSSPKKTVFGSNAEELFANLVLNDNPPADARANGESRAREAPPRAGTLPPSGHRPTRSGEEDGRPSNGPGARPPRPRGPPPPRNVFESPERGENRRPRRNSESSIMEKGPHHEEERRRRERRARDKDGKSRPHHRSRPRRANGLDLIDKLDVSGLYGTGYIHHDGPFDACNPHRNRKRDHRAPMQAFPVDSANNTLGGSGPLNKNIDLNLFHGRGAEGFTDFSANYDGKRPSYDRSLAAFDPKDRVEPIHGEESIGLGTSTFLEGAPASRTAIQRRQSENEAALAENGGLQRKKSLAQRIRGISQPRRGYAADGSRITSPEARYDLSASPQSPVGPLAKAAPSAGGGSRASEKNPFFDDYDVAYERKGATIQTVEADKAENEAPAQAPDRAPSSPGRGLQRSLTSDNAPTNGDATDAKPSGSGFLNRVRSLKGGRRRRPS